MAKHIDKQELAATIRDLQGVSDEQKSALLELLNERKRYGLVWENHEEDVEELLREQLPVLTEVPERRILSEDKDAPNHILIEGDNLHALTSLCYTHEGKIDVIYIDPPYNRGENDFKYNDKYIDKDNPFKHSLWLSFISKRLKIASKLLSDKGVMIIHIDEHEYDALHLLLETEIFNATNDMGMIIWNKLNPKGDAHNVAVMHEYILLFCKNKEVFVNQNNTLMRDKANAETIINKGLSLWNKLGKFEVPTEVKNILTTYKYPKKKISEFSVEYTENLILSEFQSWLKKNDFTKGEKAYKYLDKKGNVFRTVSMAWPNKEVAPEDYWVPLRHPITNEECPIPSKGWRNSLKRMKELLGDEEPIIYNENFIVKGEIAFTKKRNGQLNIPERVYYLKDNMMENVSSIYNDGNSDEQLLTDLQISFPYPKCLSVSKYLLKNVLRCKNAIILDFFAGSGTSLHATLQLNAEDGGNRQCILVTNNENNICEEVTYERNKKVIKGYTKPNGDFVEGLHKNNLRYYKTDFVPRDKSNINKRRLVYAATDLLCIKENLYNEDKLVVAGKNVKKNFARRFVDGDKEMLVIYEPRLIAYVVEELKSREVVEPIKVYVFCEGQYAYNDDFKEVLDKVNLCALPEAIYQAYKKVLPKRKSPEEIAVQASDDEIAEAMNDANTYSYKSEEGGLS